jgi:hypothetical protein
MKFIHISTVGVYNTTRFSAVPTNNSYFTGADPEVIIEGSPTVLYDDLAFCKEVKLIYTHGTLYEAEAQVNADWNETDESSKAYILNKPVIPDAQVNSDWNSNSGVSQILNKPTLGTAASKDVAASGNASTSQVVMGNDTRLTDARTPVSHQHTVSEITDFPTIPDAQIQADWNETNESSKAFIRNKPTIPEAQVNADWNSESGKSQILNKPTDLVHTSDIEGLLKNDGSVYTGKYLEQVRDLDNFQASEGKIVQYIGETNSKYTNGFIYKKVSSQIIIPAGTIVLNDEWQQWDSQPREDTSHYVTDSDIGWIEH